MRASRLALGLVPAVAAAGLLAAGIGPVQASARQDTGLHAALHGSQTFPRATGNARFEVRHNGRELHVSLSHATRLAGARLVIFVHGTRTGTMVVSPAGTAHLDRHHGVPATRAGQPIRVRTRAGTLVVSGTFRVDHHHGG